jgi:hypothetical protein
VNGSCEGVAIQGGQGEGRFKHQWQLGDGITVGQPNYE